MADENVEIGGKQPPPEGETKEFASGDVRKLTMTGSGKKRWTKIGEQPKVQNGTVSASRPDVSANTPILDDYKPIDHIDREDWFEYNNYLTADNPFLRAQSYEELQSIWWTIAYDLNKRLLILKDEIERVKAEGDIPTYEIEEQYNDKLEAIEDAFTKLDNQCLAVLMYKICAVVDKIEYYDHSFNYEQWIYEGKNWQEFNDYLEKIQEPDYAE